MTKVLLLESDEVLGSIYQRSLSDNYEVIWVKSVEQGVVSMDEHKIDLIILEIQIPEHNGIEFLYEIRSYKEWQSIPAIMHTNVRNERLNSKALAELNIVTYLYKPNTSIVKLRNAVDGICRSL